MNETSSPGPRWHFGDFVADPFNRTLREGSARVPLTPKTFDVLMTLLEFHGQLVEKEKLIAQIWPDTVVEENNLARHISTLRKVLRDHGPEHRFIATVPGRGYRFISPVRQTERGDSVSAAEQKPAAIDAPAPLLRPRREWHYTAALLLLTAGIAIAGGVFFFRRPAVAAESAPRRLRQLTFDSGLQSQPAWSPNGQRIAYASDRSGNFDIWTQLVGDGELIRATSSAFHDWQPAWSPDGTQIAFRSERDGGGLFVVPAAGGVEQKLASLGYFPSWSPDGTFILFYGSYQPSVREAPTLYVVGLDGAAPRKVLPDVVSKFRRFRAAWHPDGRLSIYGLRNGEWSFYTASLANGQQVASRIAPSVQHVLENSAVELKGFVWGPEGSSLYFEGVADGVQNLWRISVDPRSLEWTGGPERLTLGPGLDSNIALSPDGRTLAFASRTERTRVWSFPLDGNSGFITGAGAALAEDMTDAFYDLAPDGRVVYRTSRAGKQELWTRGLDGRQPERLTSAISIGMPRWSPDGLHLVYRRAEAASHTDGSSDQSTVLLAVNGREERQLTSPEKNLPAAMGPAPFDWSADGRSILSSCRTSEGRIGICMLPVDAAPHAERVGRIVASSPKENLFQARFSPDSRWIALNAVSNDGTSVIYAVPLQGGSWVRLTEGPGWTDKPRWSPDGRTLYYACQSGGFINLWGRHFDPDTGHVSGEPFRVTSFDSPRQMLYPYMRPLQVVVTHERLVVPVTESFGSIWLLENIRP
jgi:Tol biopolymer transport system component/DNA-binding winged helix-turn-helix (wHTH) protein